MKSERTLAYGQCAESLLDGVSNHVDVFRKFYGSVGEAAVDARNCFFVIIDLELRKFQTVRRGDDHHSVLGAYLPALDDFFESGQRHAGLGAVVHSGPVRARGGVRQLLLARLLHRALERLERPDGPLDAHRIPDLDGRRQRWFGLYWMELAEPGHVASVKGVGLFSLGANDSGHLVDQPQIAHLHEALAQRAHVSEVTAGYNDDVGDLPVELLDEFDADGFCPSMRSEFMLLAR